MRGPLGLYRVEGASMRPTFGPGDLLLGLRAGHRYLLRPDRVVVVSRPERVVVKRLVRRVGAGWWVQGDAASASTDSRHFGAVPPRDISAIVLARLGRGRAEAVEG